MLRTNDVCKTSTCKKFPLREAYLNIGISCYQKGGKQSLLFARRYPGLEPHDLQASSPGGPGAPVSLLAIITKLSYRNLDLISHLRVLVAKVLRIVRTEMDDPLGRAQLQATIDVTMACVRYSIHGALPKP